VRFDDRRDGGRRLAATIAGAALDRPVVLALPRGGVPVGFEIAAALGAPLEVFVSRKVGCPWQPELGIGAVAEGGRVLARDDVLGGLGISRDLFDALAEAVRLDLDERVQRYRGDRPLPGVLDRDVLLVDDGLATGITAHAALVALRALGARRLTLAAPAGAGPSARALRAVADQVVCVVEREDFQAVGQWYADFRQTTDAEVLDLLARSRKNVTFVNKAAFDALDKPTQEAILKAAAVAEERGWKLAEEKAKWYLEQLQANKMKVLPPPPALKAGLEKVGEQLTADWLKKAGTDGEAVIAAYKK
jgi:predicted phosphoribosyltransferase